MQTLLTLQDVAANLGCSDVMVQRLIALGVLKASQMTEGSIRSFRVTQSQLDAYIEAGSPRFMLPVGAEHLTNDDRWFDDKHTRWIGRLYEDAVTAKLSSLLPDPEDRLPAGVAVSPKAGTFRKVEVEVPESAVSELLAAPVPYGTQTIPSTNFPGRTNFDGQWRDAFLVNRLWSALMSVVAQANELHGVPSIRKLYQAPTVFQSFLNKAWDRVATGRISATRRYHIAFTEERYRDPKAQLVTATEAVQTIEVELILTMKRIAQGRMASIVQRAL